MSYATRLAKVRDAIDAILDGAQSVRYGERQVTLADLGELRRLEKDYEASATAEARAGRNRVTYVVPPG